MEVLFIGFLAALGIFSGCDLTVAKSFSGLKDQAYAVVGDGDIPQQRRRTRSIPPSITRMKITSVVKTRFAKVKTVSEMHNSEDIGKELTFSIRLPKAAFITEFNMVVDGVTFIGKVKEKSIAEREYQGAKAKDHVAGLVTANVRETETFNVAANVPAHSSATFTLVYQELLRRRLGKYEQAIFVNPGQIVDDIAIDVFITEDSGITIVAAKPPRSHKETERAGNGEVQIDTDIRRSKHQAKVSFKPTQTQQRRLFNIPEDERKFTVIYDVTRENLGGEIQTRDGYFVHYFAPENLPVLPKKVVFVIDRSGSMHGRKMEQTKTAFETVLKEMAYVDEFNIVTFASDVVIWKPDVMVRVTDKNIRDAVAHVKRIEVSGSTNLNDGLLEGANLLRNVRRGDEVSSAIITLTDGDPTTGVVDTDLIRSNVKQAVGGRFSVFCIGFGRHLNYDFLKRLARDNDGITRKIYEDSDADLQLEGFFKEVAAPLLLNVQITYSGSGVVDVSQTTVDKYFGGSEVIVVGANLQSDVPLVSRITGISKDGEVDYTAISKETDDSFRHSHDDAGDFNDVIERIWAYYTIKRLLEKRVLTESQDEKNRTTRRAMDIALKYHFVTPLTSMVVTLPEDEITTTSNPSVTGKPPIPQCLMRGTTIPDNILRPPIWCPYIFDQSRPQQRLQGRHQARHDIARMSLVRTLSSSRRNFALWPRIASRPQLHGARISLSNRMASPMAYDYPHFIPLPIERANNCSGLLTSAEGRITAPRMKFSEAVHCEWNVELEEGSWIDLFVETLNTTSNELKITGGDGEILLKHDSGVTPSKYFSVQHNRLRVVMTIRPEDSIRPGIVISYRKFVPQESTSPTEAEYVVLSPNCGGNISSHDAMSGHFISPNYPSYYPSNVNCVWTITNEEPSRALRIQIVDMDIETNDLEECTYDRLFITDGNQNDVICGQHYDIFTSLEEHITVSFVSDDEFEAKGFRAEYEFVSTSS